MQSSAIDHRELTFKASAGLIGGAIGWIPVELATHGQSLTQQQTIWAMIAGVLSMAILAGVIGGMIRAAESNSLQLTPLARRRFTMGFLVCLVLAIPETVFSDMVFTQFLRAGGWGINHAGSLPYLIAGRLTGWMLMGLMLGIGVGLAGASLRNALRGGLGGLIGGFVGGAGFDFIGAASQSGLAPRLVGFCLLGLAIGFFIGLVHQLTKSAWLAVEAGRLKGRQFRLEASRITIGRAEENVVGLFGDPAVQQRHAVITRQGEDYWLKNLAVQAGTLVNGNRIESVGLSDGDRIRLGGYVMSFHLRAERASQAVRPPLAAAAAPAAAMATPANVVIGEAHSELVRADGIDGDSAAYLRGARGQQFPLSRNSAVRLGRALDNDIVINDASVSRHHASIETRNGEFVLRDLGSQNGTWLGERRITESLLNRGDSLRLGNAAFTFHD